MKVRKKDNIDVLCKCCEHASPLASEEVVVCAKYGVVRWDHKCGKFSYDPLKRNPVKAVRNFEEFGFTDSDETDDRIIDLNPIIIEE